MSSCTATKLILPTLVKLSRRKLTVLAINASYFAVDWLLELVLIWIEGISCVINCHCCLRLKASEAASNIFTFILWSDCKNVSTFDQNITIASISEDMSHSLIQSKVLDT